MAEGTKVGGAYIEITADSAPAEKAVATFFNWFSRTGEAATDLASKISNTVETAKDLGEKGSQSAKTVSTGFQSMTQKMKSANASLSADSKKNFDQMKSDAKLSYSEMTKDSKAMNKALVISMKSSVSNLKSSFTDLKNGFKTIGNSLLDLIKKPVDKVIELPGTIQRAMKSVTGFVSSGFAQAKNQAISQIQSIPTKATQVLNRTKDVFVTGFNSIVNTTASAVSKIGNGLSQLPSKASQVASNIRTGFVNGIKSIPSVASNIWQSVKSGIKSISTSASDASRSVKNNLTSGFKSVFDKAKSIFPNIRNQIKSGVNDPAINSKRSIEDLATSIASIAIVSKAFGVLSDSIGRAIDRIDTIDTATKSLTVLTGSAGIAKQVMDDLAAAIEGTPIALNDVAMGAKKMVAAGMEGTKVKGVFQAIADAAYGVGNGAESIDQITSAIAGMQSAGVIYADDINRLVDAGIPAWQILANASKKSVTDMKEAVSDGTLSAGDAIEDLRRGIEEGTEGVAGSTAKMAGLAKTAGDTLSGSMANFKTAITTTIVKGLEPFKKVAVDALGSATASIKAFRDNTIGAEKVQGVLNSIARSLEGISKSANPLISVVKGLVTALLSFGSLILVINLFSKLKSIFLGFITALQISPFAIVAAAVIGLAVAITDLYKRSEKFRQLVAPLINFVKKLGETFVTAGNAIHGALQLIFVGGDRKKTEALRENLNQLLPQQTVNVIIDRLTALHKAFGEFREKTSEKFGLAAQAIKGSFDLIFVGGDRGKTEELKQTLNNLFPQENANKILERLTILHKAFDQLKKDASERVQVASNIIRSSLDQILNGGDRKQYEDLKLALADFLPQDTVNAIMNRITILHESFNRLKNGIQIVKDVLTGDMDFHSFSEAINTNMFSDATIQRFEKFYEIVQQIRRAFLGLKFIISGNITSLEGLTNLFGDSFSENQLKMIYRLGQDIRNFVQGVKQQFAEFKIAIDKAFDGNFEPLLNIFKSLLPKIIAILVGGIPGLIITGSNLISKLAEGMGTTVPDLLEKVSEIVLGLVTSFTEILPKMIEVGVNLLTNIIQGILQTLIPLAQAAVTVAFTISKTIIETLLSVLPQLIESGVTILTAIITGIIQMLPNLISAVISLVEMILSLIITYLPKIIEAGMTILVALINGIMMMLPKLIELAFNLIISLVTTLIQSLPKIIEAGVKILGSLIQGILNVLPKLIELAIKLIITIVAILIQNLPKIIGAGVQILLALGKGILNTIGVLIKMLPQVVDAIFKAFGDVKWWEIGKDILLGIGKGITDALGSLKKTVTDVAGNVSKWFKDKLKIKSPSRVMIGIAKWVPEGVAVGIEKGLPVIEGVVSTMTDMMTKAVQDAEPVGLSNDMIVTESYGMPDASQMQASAQQASQAGNQGMSDSTPQLLQTALSAANGILGQFSSISPSMVTQGADWLTNFMNGWNSVAPTMLATTNSFIVQYTTLITSQNSPNYQMGRTWMQNKLNGWNSLVSTFITTVRNFCNQVLNLLRSFYNAMYQTGRTWLQNLLNGWNTLYQTFINRVNQLGNDAINNLRSKSGGFNSAGRFLMQSLIDGINSMGGSLATTMNGVANKMIGGIGKGVNGVIAGVNHVMKEVESDKRLGDWSPPRYARGTDGHPADGPAIVNDQKGSKYQEIIQEPDGSTFIAKGRNALVWLKKGAKVLNATMTERVLKAQNNLGSTIPKYEDGIGEFDIFDLIDDEGAFKKLVDQRVDYNSIVEPWRNMTKAGVKLMTNAAYPFAQKQVEDAYGGSFDGAMNANNVYQYLVDIAQKVMSKFGGLTITSGYRLGDPYWHGKHQALDISGYPYGSPRYTEAANWAFEKFPKQIAYVITNGRVRDRVGMSGQAATGQWVPWPAGDHYDHIHLNGALGSGNIFKAGTDVAGGLPTPGGSAVERWRSYVKKALKMNGLPTTQAYVNAWMSQIQTESGGNPSAIGGNDGLADGNATGLLQTKPGTFAANAFPGHGNIMNGFDNILAAIRYAKGRYGSNMLGVIGHGHGYENGGWITQDGLYRAGEKGKPEVVLPVTKPARAMELIGQAISYMVNNGSNILDSASIGLNNLASNMTVNLAEIIGMETQGARNFMQSKSGGMIDLTEIINLLKVNNELLHEIAVKDSSTYLDKKKVSQELAEPIAKEIVRKGL
ncbi:tape measure protein [Enterococcus sp. HMSC29A04]|uniref:tape measure protein n=1 Tax=unclassified Enterococcus TaxID=2608891 RepID=UPI0007F47BEE|nr:MULTISPECIES: tape measure protein [unclassified Enterococcus]OFT90115.1 tape measure protein [Enterococcus sp. HMSC29A04]OFU67548.1 tape measure protein [Enterococcus sp. HMSC14A10]SAM69986.1 phage tail tape measure protein TP901 [Enterococcus faecium]